MELNERILEKIEQLGLHNAKYDDVVKKLSLELKVNPYNVSHALTELTESGEIILGGKNKVILTKFTNFKKGTFLATTKEYGFFRFEEQGKEDVFVAKEHMKGARHGDTVLVKITNPQEHGINQRAEGEIVSVCKRGTTRVVGVLNVSARTGVGFVISDDKKIGDVFIPANASMNVKNNHKVVCEITEYNAGKNLVGRVIEDLGMKGDKQTDMMAIIRKYNIREEFPQSVIAEANKLPNEVKEHEYKDRKTFFDNNVITIDGDYSKDFDDAIHGYKNTDGTYTVFIHIADVNNYVKAGSEIDKEALKRGTSHYPPGMVIPMLPEKLSNQICSLNEGVVRLTLTCEVKLDKKMNVISSDVYESAIISKHRMTYNKVRKILNGDEELRTQYADVVPMIEMLNTVAVKLKEQRVKAGEIEFDLPEPEFIEDENHNVIDIQARTQGESEELIESLMILANVCVAKKYKLMDAPFVYRIHEKPTELKMGKMLSFFARLGISMEGIEDPTNLTPKDVQKLMLQLDGKPYENSAKSVLLRTMSKAKYATQNLGHYGLALKYYSHFTSPIRRYPDLTIHRIIKKDLELQRTRPELNEQQRSAILKKEFQGFAMKSAELSSEAEVNAQKCEYETHDFKRADYLSHHIGEVFEGKISGVTEYGLFVELSNTCEGLIRTDSLPDDTYVLSPDGFTLKGTKNTYTIGADMKVKVANVNMETYKIDFVLPEHELYLTENKSKKNEIEL